MNQTLSPRAVLNDSNLINDSSLKAIQVISDLSHQLMTSDSDSNFKNLPNKSGVKSHDCGFVQSPFALQFSLTTTKIASLFMFMCVSLPCACVSNHSSTFARKSEERKKRGFVKFLLVTKILPHLHLHPLRHARVLTMARRRRSGMSQHCIEVAAMRTASYRDFFVCNIVEESFSLSKIDKCMKRRIPPQPSPTFVIARQI